MLVDGSEFKHQDEKRNIEEVIFYACLHSPLWRMTVMVRLRLLSGVLCGIMFWWSCRCRKETVVAARMVAEAVLRRVYSISMRGGMCIVGYFFRQVLSLWLYNNSDQ